LFGERRFEFSECPIREPGQNPLVHGNGSGVLEPQELRSGNGMNTVGMGVSIEYFGQVAQMFLPFAI